MTVRFRPEAESDLVAITIQIAEASASRATEMAARLRKRCAILDAHPHAGRARPEIGNAIRCLVQRPYVIFYRIVEADVEVLAIVHGARDLSAVMAKRAGVDED